MKKNEPSIYPVIISGFCAVIIQCVLIRELLSVFFGNELILGIILSVWLLSCGIGSYLGNRSGIWNSGIYSVLLAFFASCSLIIIRYFPLLFERGAVIPTIAIACLFIAAESPVSFLCGYIFGTLSQRSSQRRHIYGLENIGSLTGAAVLYTAILMESTNAVILILALVPLPLIPLFDKYDFPRKKNFRVGLVLLLGVILSIIIIKTDKKSASVKYAGDVTDIQYTREGEIASMIQGPDTTLFLNNKVYKSTLDKIVAEQAVHIPAAQRKDSRNALVIFDRGHLAELSKYKNLHIDILETLPAFAHKRSIITTPEQYHTGTKYNLIYIGAGLPENTASGRFYTVSFLKHMKTIMAPKAVLSFTLPFNENYMPENEQQLYSILINTLKSTFDFVLVFPGNGYATFMASEDTLFIPETVTIKNDYLSSFILPALSDERIVKANQPPEITAINKNTKPIALFFSIKNWMDIFGLSDIVLTGILLAIVIGATVILPKSKSVLSVASSGFATGLYSVGIMLLYQGAYGSLYSEISLLLIALSLGFAAGSKLTRFPLSDFILGVYFLLSFILLSIIPQPHRTLFLVCHFGIGFLSAGQFVTRKDTVPGVLNTADCIGGVFGMALSSTVLIPLFGIIPVAIGIAVMKIIIEINNKIHY